MKMSTQCLNPMRHLFQPDPIRKSLTLISHSLLQVWPLPTAWGIRSKWFTTVAWFHQDFRLTPLDPRLNSPFLWNCLSNQLNTINSNHIDLLSQVFMARMVPSSKGETGEMIQIRKKNTPLSIVSNGNHIINCPTIKLLQKQQQSSN